MDGRLLRLDESLLDRPQLLLNFDDLLSGLRCLWQCIKLMQLLLHLITSMNRNRVDGRLARDSTHRTRLATGRTATAACQIPRTRNSNRGTADGSQMRRRSDSTNNRC